MVKRIKETKTSITSKGLFKNMDKEGLYFEDEKTGDVELISFDEIKAFIGKTATFAIADSIKKEIDEE